MDSWRYLGLVWVMLAWSAPVFAADGIPSAAVEVAGDPVQPAGAPILLTLTIRNTGKLPIRYWWSGPSDYPQASEFIAEVTAVDHDKTDSMTLSNGQTAGASGRSREIAPGGAISFPVALPRLSQGVYQIDVVTALDDRQWPITRTVHPIVIRLIDDESLLAARDAQILARIRANDPFAQYVAASWPRERVRQALRQDLKGDDIVAADRAAEGLWYGLPPPATDAAIVRCTILHHLKIPRGCCDVGLMEKLLMPSGDRLAGQIRDAALRLVDERKAGPVYDAAVWALYQPQHGRMSPRAAMINPPSVGLAPSLPSYPIPPLGTPNHGKGDDAVQVARHDAMIVLLQSDDPSDRQWACGSLADFPDSLEAVEALRNAAHDPDATVRQAAADALETIGYRRALPSELPVPAGRP